MTQLNQYKKDFVLLLELGFIAVNQADETSARQLFEASHLLDPKSALPNIGLGYLHLHKLEVNKAIALFEKVLKEEPTNEMAKAFLGFCFALAPNKELDGKKLLKQTVESKDPLVKNLSTSCIEFIDKFIIKPAGPASIESPITKK